MACILVPVWYDIYSFVRFVNVCVWLRKFCFTNGKPTKSPHLPGDVEATPKQANILYVTISNAAASLTSKR